jgi:predicted RNA polymerase sigma factor
MGTWGEFEAWYVIEHPRVLAALTLIGGDADLAREATDEAMARVWERRLLQLHLRRLQLTCTCHH